MFRLLVITVLLSIGAFLAAAEEPAVRRVVDLDARDAMEALQTSNPIHYAKVRRILDGILHQPEARVSRWMLDTLVMGAIATVAAYAAAGGLRIARARAHLLVLGALGLVVIAWR